MIRRKKASENIVGKGENAGNQHFLLFARSWHSYQGHKASFKMILITIKLLYANAFNLDQSYVLSFGEGLSFSTSPNDKF